MRLRWVWSIDHHHSIPQVRVVEINNPPPVAGTALFDWDNEADRHALQHGPFELRCVPHMNR